MQNTSEIWKTLAVQEETHVEAKATINGVEYTDIDPPTITRALMQSGLEVGNVVSAMCAFTLDTDDVIPKSAEVQIETRLVGGTDEQPVYSEWLPQGTFYISKRVRDPNTGLRSFECYDALLKTNAPWSVSGVTWPRQAEDVVDDILTVIGLELDERSTIADYSISEPVEGTTMRDLLSIIAQQNGGNWIVSPNNELRLVPIVDLQGAEEAENVIDVDAVIGDYYVGGVETITGIRYSMETGTAIIGDDTGAVVSVSVAGIIATDLAESLVGMTYRPYTFGTAYYDIAAELGDYITCDDISSVLYSETVVLGAAMHGDISAPDIAEIDDEYPYVGSSDKTLTLAKAAVNEAVEQLDNDLTQQEIFNRLTDNGAAQGLVLYNGQLYVNANYINAGYLSAARIKGDVLTLGGENNVNGTMQVLNASGDIAAVINNLGMEMIDGSVISYSTDRQTRTRVANGTIAIQKDFGEFVPFGWQDLIGISTNSNGAHIQSTLGGTLFIRGGGRLYLSNEEYGGVPDEDYAKIDMDDDSITISVISDYTDGADITLTPTSIRFQFHEGAFGYIRRFEFSGDASDYPLNIGNGGTGANNAADARTNLGITPANIGAVSNSAKVISFGGSETAFSANIITELETMAIGEIRAIRAYCDAATTNFINGATYVGFIYKIHTTFATGLITDNVASTCLLARSGNDTVMFKQLTSAWGVVPITAGGTGGNGSVFKGGLTASDNLNNLLESGYWEASSGNLPANRPADATDTNTFVLNYNLPTTDEVYQIYVTFSGGKVYRWERRYFAGSWGAWQRVWNSGDSLFVNTPDDNNRHYLGVDSPAGNIFFYADGTSSGYRGIWVNNGSGGKYAISVNSNDDVTLNGTAANVTGVVQVDHGGTGGNGMVYKGAKTASDDLNDIHESGYWYCTGSNYPGNVPETGKYGFIINYHFTGLNYDYQIFTVSYYGISARYERRYNNGAWSGWKKVQYTT